MAEDLTPSDSAELPGAEAVEATKVTSLFPEGHPAHESEDRSTDETHEINPERRAR